MTSRIEDLQNVREMMVNYDELSNKKLDDCHEYNPKLEKFHHYIYSFLIEKYD